MKTAADHYRAACKLIESLDTFDEGVAKKVENQGGYLGPVEAQFVESTRKYSIEKAKLHALLAQTPSTTVERADTAERKEAEAQHRRVMRDEPQA